MKTHTQRTLELLKEAGDKGVHSFTLNYKVGTTRSAARINDLKRQGYNITSIIEKMGDSTGVRYFLLPQDSKQRVKEKQEDRPFKWVFEGNFARKVYL